MNEIKFEKCSGYTSSEGFSPVYSSSEGDKTSLKRFNKVKIMAWWKTYHRSIKLSDYS